uniref:Uncharacterized protein n=1 Tax=Pristionchus pacificus TaxID=54126 RepID=A0A2A6CSA8_PRIPA
MLTLTTRASPSPPSVESTIFIASHSEISVDNPIAFEIIVIFSKWIEKSFSYLIRPDIEWRMRMTYSQPSNIKHELSH